MRLDWILAQPLDPGSAQPSLVLSFAEPGAIPAVCIVPSLPSVAVCCDVVTRCGAAVRSETGRVSHYIIQRQPNGQYGIGDEMFPDLVRVLEFYKTHLLDTTTLSSPLPLDHAAQNGVLCPNFIMEVRHMSYRDSRISD